LVDRRDEVVRRLSDVVTGILAQHAEVLGTLRARRADEHAVVEQLHADAAELAARQFPEPPAAPWQRDQRGPSLTELIDFAPGLDDSQRAGLEAAMEGAGLLGAEVTSGGGLRLETGELVVGATHAVSRPLT